MFLEENDDNDSSLSCARDDKETASLGMTRGEESGTKNENMKKEHKILIMMAAGTLFLQACTETEVVVQEGTGSVEFRCSTVNGVQYSPASTKADGQTRTLPEGILPESADLKLGITGPDGYSAEYETVAAYDAPQMRAGDYTAVFSYGNPEREGSDAAYFETGHPFTVVARKSSIETVTVPLANSVVSVTVSQWFADYYPEYDIRIETESGYAMAFSGEDTEPEAESEPVFVKAGTSLYFSGTAVKTNGVEVSFPRTEIAVTKARTWQTLGIDASEAAGGTVEIVLNDSVVEVKEISIELNPDAPDMTESDFDGK